MLKGILLAAALGACGDNVATGTTDSEWPDAPMSGPVVKHQQPTGDYPDGTLLRFRVTAAEPVGSSDCGVRESWTWRYYANRALVADGPNPRVGVDLDFDPLRHEFDAHYPTVAPIGTKTEQVRLFQGGSFTHSVWFGGQSEYDEGCATFLSGVVEAISE